MQRDDHVRTQRRWPPTSQGTLKALRTGERPGMRSPPPPPCFRHTHPGSLRGEHGPARALISDFWPQN